MRKIKLPQRQKSHNNKIRHKKDGKKGRTKKTKNENATNE